MPSETIVQMLDFVPVGWRSMELFLLALAEKLRETGRRTVHVFAGEPSQRFRERLAELESPYFVARFQPSPAEALTIARLLRQFEPDLLQVTFMSKFGPALPILKFGSGSRWLVAADQSSGTVNGRGGAWALLSAARGMAAAFYLDRVIAVSDFVRRRDVVQLNLPRARVLTIHNGIVMEAAGAPHPRNSDFPIIAYVGQLIREKGVLTLLKAAKALQTKCTAPFRLIIAGQGSQEKELKSYCADACLRNVEFVGQISWVSRLFATADVVVVPSEWEEAFGFVVVEAMAAGACVIGSDAGAIPEIIGPYGQAGLLYSRGNVVELTARLEEVLSNPSRRGQIGCAGRARVAERFTLGRMVDGYVAVYDDLLRSRHNHRLI
jgi:glycosyltransferase involved in cell wall biosynthesis